MRATGRPPGDACPGPQAKSKRRKKPFSPLKGRLPVLLVLALLCYLAVTFTSQFGRLAVMQQDVRNIKQQIDELEQKNNTLREELRKAQSDSYIEKTAREKLGLIKPNETRVVPVAPGTELKKIEPPAKTGAPSE